MIPTFEATSYEFTEYVTAKNYIGGAWRDTQSGIAPLPVLNPRHGQSMADCIMSNYDDVAAEGGECGL